MLLGIFQALLLLLAIAFVGRVVLALLPVGALGSHGARELLATWAVSHLLGLATFTFAMRAADGLGLELAWGSARPFLLAWAVVAGARMLFLPGALVPRHPPRTERAHGVVFVVLAAAVALVGAAGCGEQERIESPVSAGFIVCSWEGPPPDGLPALLGLEQPGLGLPLLPTTSILALIVLVAHGLAVARRAPLARALVILWLAWLVFLVRGLVRAGNEAELLLAVGGGAASSVAWFRRGDRRGLAIAALALGSVAFFAPSAWGVALACLSVIVLASPRTAWRIAGTWCAVGTVLALVGACWRTEPLSTPTTEVPHASLLVAFLVPALALAASAHALRGLVLRKPDPRERIDGTTREAAAIGAMLLVGSLLALTLDAHAWTVFAEGMPHVPRALLPFLGLVPLLVGLVGAPDERTLPPA